MEREEATCGGDRFASFLKNQAEVPFRFRAGEPKSPEAEISQEQPPGFSGILQAKPDTIFSGAKRKAIILIEQGADKPSLSSSPVTNVSEWNCELCQVSTTNKDCLNDHFKGKKHKRKEAALREHKDDKNCSIGFLAKKSKFIQLVERPCNDLISGKKSEEGSSSPNDNDPPSLLIDGNADDLRKKAAHEKQNNKEFTFWCDTCKIGTFAENVMEMHKMGKKHKRNEENKNCSTDLSPMKPQFIQLVEHPCDDLISAKKLQEG